MINLEKLKRKSASPTLLRDLPWHQTFTPFFFNFSASPSDKVNEGVRTMVPHKFAQSLSPIESFFWKKPLFILSESSRVRHQE